MFLFRMRMNGTLPVRALTMKYHSSKVKVWLLGQSTESNYCIGNILQVSAVYAKNVSKQRAVDKVTKFQMRGKRKLTFKIHCRIKLPHFIYCGNMKTCGGPILVGTTNLHRHFSQPRDLISCKLPGSWDLFPHFFFILKSSEVV